MALASLVPDFINRILQFRGTLREQPVKRDERIVADSLANHVPQGLRVGGIHRLTW